MSEMHFMVRGSRDFSSIAGAVRSQLLELDPLVPIAMSPLSRQIGSSLGNKRLLLAVATAFGAIALMLAAVGVHSIVAFTARRREREVGIKMVLGARPGRVRADMLRTGVLPALIGVLLGGVAIVPVGRALASQVFAVGQFDPVAILGAAVLLVGAALLAAYLPARRATRVEPATVLRQE